MNLTEGQLFTIEALNRIEGFVWPEKAKFAEVDGGCIAYFYESDSTGSSPLTSVRVKDPYDKRKINASITREQFDSIDGWVRNDGSEPVISGDFEVMFRGGSVAFDLIGVGASELNWKCPCDNGDTITHWRYHKPTKETEMQQPKQFKNRDNIETLIDKRKDAIEQKRIALAALEEAEAKERELMLSIQAWAESYGFDIRVLDESDEVPDVEPELVITDWRDLRVGDEIWWSGGAGFSSGQYIISEVSKKGVSVTTWKGQSWLDVLNTAWKFIRRPSK